MTATEFLTLILAFTVMLSLQAIIRGYRRRNRPNHTGLLGCRSYNLDENGDIIDDSP